MSISIEARRVHAYIVQYEQEHGNRPKLPEIAEHFDISKPVIRRWLNELIIAGATLASSAPAATTGERRGA